MQQPILSTPHIVRSAQRAVREKRLGIQRGATEPLALYPDGSVCAFSAALPLDVLRRIVADGNANLNWLALKREEYFGLADLMAIEVLAALQLGYDACCLPDEPEAVREKRIKAFCCFVRGLDPDAPSLLHLEEHSPRPSDTI